MSIGREEPGHIPGLTRAWQGSPSPGPLSPGLPSPGPRHGSPLRRQRRRPGLLIGLFAAGVAVLALAVAGIVGQVLPRTFTAQQARAIMAWETSSRWRDWPAGRIFPAAVTYQLPGTLFASRAGLAVTADRIGIARASTCRPALAAAAERLLGRAGCAGALRATYDDQTQALVVTVGVVVTPGRASARRFLRALGQGGGGRPVLRSLPFRQTIAARFGDAARQLNWHTSAGPYVILATAGYADGRAHVPVRSDPYAWREMLSLARGVGSTIAAGLGAPPAPPHCPGAPGC